MKPRVIPDPEQTVEDRVAIETASQPGLDVAAGLDVDEGAVVVEDVMSVLEEVAARGVLAFVVPDGDAVGVTFPDEQGDQVARTVVVGFRRPCRRG